MCKTSQIYLKITHANYLCHSETLAFLPRLAPDISAFRTANYVFWRAAFKGTLSCGRARCNACFFLLSGTSISGPKSNFTVCTHVTCQSSNVIYCSGCQPVLYWYTLSNLSENLYTLAIALKFSAVKV